MMVQYKHTSKKLTANSHKFSQWDSFSHRIQSKTQDLDSSLVSNTNLSEIFPLAVGPTAR